NFQPRRLAVVLQVLRCMTNRGEGINARAGTNGGASFDDDMRNQFHIIPQPNLRADNAIWPDARARTEHGISVDNGGRMDDRRNHASAPTIMAVISASAIIV